ncbi:hypothetical protein [Pseudomonas sp. Irchel s3h14]|uniref:hypothetical protein n=1 Tax=Pseudomonas sp. Irchel s3h14 TaxID=2009179 RepID=UPI000BA31920|nr:hypothetical protein [Pseudomonas sp. Irchel s3h14]
MRHLLSIFSALAILSVTSTSFAEAPGGVIRSAEGLTYKQLLAQGGEPMKYPKDCCSLLYSPGTPKSEYHFELQDAFFVLVEVDAVKLASVLFRMSCQNRGFFNPTIECSPEELKNKVDEALKVNYSGSLYGKYRASWVAKQNGQMLPNADKWGGQNIYSFNRENGVDEIIVGPIKGLPTSIGLSDFDEMSVTPAVKSK